MKELHCSDCDKFLGIAQYGLVSIKCSRCKKVNVFTVISQSKEIAVDKSCVPQDNIHRQFIKETNESR
jgi:phage FluMu protein Com